jgi:DNA polymerase III epsilon subunit-like protein
VTCRSPVPDANASSSSACSDADACSEDGSINQLLTELSQPEGLSSSLHSAVSHESSSQQADENSLTDVTLVTSEESVDEGAGDRNQDQLLGMCNASLQMYCSSSPVLSSWSHPTTCSSPVRPFAVPLTVQYDMCWQKRSSGRAYNSLSGVGSMIGRNTGKIVGYGLRCKSCRVCSYWNSKEKDPPNHKCTINFTGSSKAMEPDVACEIVHKLEEKGDVIVDTFVMDEDCATISRVRREVDHEVFKWSDIMHVKKHLTSKLYKLQKSHRVLSADVIKYIVKCFSYVLCQNKGNVEGVKCALMNVVPHMFGEHSNCGSWCRYHATNSDYKHSSLPHGSDLYGAKLRQDLQMLFDELANNAQKLAPCATTRENESFNNIVASKAPKARHYSSSFSLKARVDCAVAQKNRGHVYLSDVYKGLKISPGSFYSVHARNIDRKRKFASEYKRSLLYKRRRLNARKARVMNQMTSEVREGTTYGRNVDFIEVANEDIEQIPVPVNLPSYEPLVMQDATWIVFDLETTSLKKTCDIIQLSACVQDDVFNCYVKPKQSISSKVTEITGLDFRNSVMHHRGVVVEAVSIETCLKEFVEWLKKYQQVLLIAHNCKRFDSYRLMYQLKLTNNLDLLAAFTDVVCGFADTLPLFREIYKDEIVNCKQVTVAAHVLGSDFVYDAHNAKEDVLVLHKVLLCCKQPSSIISYSFSANAVLQEIERDTCLIKNVQSLQPLLEHKVCGLATVRRIAASGLSMNHLKLAYSRNGELGLQLLFGEKDANQSVRVSKSTRVAHVIAAFLTDDL